MHGTPFLNSLAHAEAYVKVQLMLNQRKWKKSKTSSKKGTNAPYFNEAFIFPVPINQLQVESREEGKSGLGTLCQAKLTTVPSPCLQSVDLVLAVWARGLQLRAEPVGKVFLGPRASGQPLQHWADMLAHARRPIAQWHHLRSPGEVDRALALQPRLPLLRPRS